MQNLSCGIPHDIPGARKDKNGQDVAKNAKDTNRDEENTFDCRFIDKVLIVILDYIFEMKNIRCLKRPFGPQEVNRYINVQCIAMV